MSWVLTVPETSADHFVDNVPWSRLNGDMQHQNCPRVVVDVGGSRRGLCEALLKRYPDIEQAIVEDLPEVTKKNLQDQKAELAGRIKYQAYDFFTEQGVANADVYMLRTVIHDWPDSYAIRILQNQIPALKPGARILINDICIEEPQGRYSITTQAQTAHDMMVKMALNAKERTRQEWHELVSAVDGGFKVESIVSPPHAAHSIIEIVWQGHQ